MSYEVIRRPGAPIEESGYPGFNPRTETVDGLIIDRDVAIPLRDGIIIYADIFRPEDKGESDLAVLIGWGPYGKHGAFTYDVFYRNGGVTPDMVSPHCIFEAPDPAFWCPEGVCRCLCGS